MVELEDFAPVVVFAETRSRAKWIAVYRWRDANFGTDGRWPSPLRAIRARRLDNSSLNTDGNKSSVFMVDYVEDME